MKLVRSAAALALFAAAPAFAATTVLDFEHVTSFASVAQYYAGGTDSAGAVGSAYGVTFGGDVLGLSNDELGPYFSSAPSALGVMTVVGSDATMNVAAGFVDTFSFYYSSSAVVASAVNVYSGLNGTGNLLASFTLVNNAQSNGCTTSSFCRFDQVASTFAGTAHSVTFGNAVYAAAFDNISLNISAVPEPSTTLLMALGIVGMIGFVQARRT